MGQAGSATRPAAPADVEAMPARGPETQPFHRPSAGGVLMPPPTLLDLDGIDLTVVRFSRDDVYRILPQRDEFQSLDGILHLDREARAAVGFRDITADDWWARGHLPGRPIFPGILMLETAAQLAAWISRQCDAFDGFVAFGGVDRCKFRDAVKPPARIHFLCVGREFRTRRIICDTQALVDGVVVFEAIITGMFATYDRL